MKESTIGAVGSRGANGGGPGSLFSLDTVRQVCAGDKAAFGDNVLIVPSHDVSRRATLVSLPRHSF